MIDTCGTPLHSGKYLYIILKARLPQRQNTAQISLINNLQNAPPIEVFQHIFWTVICHVRVIYPEIDKH